MDGPIKETQWKTASRTQNRISKSLSRTMGKCAPGHQASSQSMLGPWRRGGGSGRPLPLPSNVQVQSPSWQRSWAPGNGTAYGSLRHGAQQRDQAPRMAAGGNA